MLTDFLSLSGRKRPSIQTCHRNNEHRWNMTVLSPSYMQLLRQCMFLIYNVKAIFSLISESMDYWCPARRVMPLMALSQTGGLSVPIPSYSTYHPGKLTQHCEAISHMCGCGEFSSLYIYGIIKLVRRGRFHMPRPPCWLLNHRPIKVGYAACVFHSGCWRRLVPTISCFPWLLPAEACVTLKKWCYQHGLAARALPLCLPGSCHHADSRL